MSYRNHFRERVSIGNMIKEQKQRLGRIAGILGVLISLFIIARGVGII
jgi:hypothetical protein